MALTPAVRHVDLTRYITPLREGGSLPAIAEADDGFEYVVKFKGAGQGQKALIAELIGGLLAKTLRLRVPEVVFCQLDAGFGRSEPDEEIQDLLKASTGLNLALHYLRGATTYDPASFAVDPMEASRIVWLDAFIKNVDRTVKNTNLLVWQKELWLIDNGAALYFHHAWNKPGQEAEKPFPLIKDHVLLPYALALEEADEFSRGQIDQQTIRSIVDTIPPEWLLKDSPFQSIEEHRQAYFDILSKRLYSSSQFVNEAINAAKALV